MTQQGDLPLWKLPFQVQAASMQRSARRTSTPAVAQHSRPGVTSPTCKNSSSIDGLGAHARRLSSLVAGLATAAMAAVAPPSHRPSGRTTTSQSHMQHLLLPCLGQIHAWLGPMQVQPRGSELNFRRTVFPDPLSSLHHGWPGQSATLDPGPLFCTVATLGRRSRASLR